MILLDQFPLTSNGKIDSRALPDPDDHGWLAGQYVAPGTETEKALVTIWEEVLGVGQVGIRDNFFELGGHSIRITRMVSAMRKKLGIELAVRDIFDHPMIEPLAAHVRITKTDRCCRRYLQRSDRIGLVVVQPGAVMVYRSVGRKRSVSYPGGITDACWKLHPRGLAYALSEHRRSAWSFADGRSGAGEGSLPGGPGKGALENVNGGQYCRGES